MKKIISLLFILFSFLLSIAQNHDLNKSVDSLFKSYNATGTFICQKNDKNLIFHNPFASSLQHSPGETFFLINTLIALKENVINSSDQNYCNSLTEKNQSYQSRIIKQTKKGKIKKELIALKYGNGVLKGDLDKIWFNGSLKITSLQQLDFIKKLYKNQLPYNKENQNLILNCFNKDDTLGYTISSIYGKTKNINGTNNVWHIGYIEKEEDVYFFVNNFSTSKEYDYQLILEGITEKILFLSGIIPIPIIEPKIPEATLDEMIGQMIMVGLNGVEVSDTSKIIKAIKKGKTGGVIFYGKNININSPAKSMLKLSKDLNNASKHPLFIGIDQEGGIINRLKEKYGFPKTYSAGYLGSIDNLDSTRIYTEILASTLKEVGVNVNFGPVVDVNTNPDNPIIAKYERSFSDNPEIVSKHAIEYIKAHHKYNIITVLKHFPGHGSSTGDSHHNMVDVTETWNKLELIPYKRIINAGVGDAIMTAHLINRQLEKKDIPATLSKTIMNDLLREKLGFNSVIFSDDMQMRAISKFYGLEEAIKNAILSGVDIVMYSLNIEGTDDHQSEEVHNIIKTLIQKGEISEERIKSSYKRIMLLKMQYLYAQDEKDNK